MGIMELALDVQCCFSIDCHVLALYTRTDLAGEVLLVALTSVGVELAKYVTTAVYGGIPQRIAHHHLLVCVTSLDYINIYSVKKQYRPTTGRYCI
jgi:hypothetical protein